MIKINGPKVIIRNELPEDCHTAVFKLVCKFGITNILKNLIIVLNDLNSKNEGYISDLSVDIELGLRSYQQRYDKK